MILTNLTIIALFSITMCIVSYVFVGILKELKTELRNCRNEIMELTGDVSNAREFALKLHGTMHLLKQIDPIKERYREAYFDTYGVKEDTVQLEKKIKLKQYDTPSAEFDYDKMLSNDQMIYLRTN